MNNPVEKSAQMEKNIIKDGKRYFGAFMAEESVDGTFLSANVYGVGCNVNCYYCASLIRDYNEGYVPDINLKYNKKSNIKSGYYSPKELLEVFLKIAKDPFKFGSPTPHIEVTQFAILDCETTIGIEYVFDLLVLLKEHNEKNNTRYVFSLFTNGIILGSSDDLMHRLSEYKDYLNVRLSLKGGTAEEFANRIDVLPRFFESPYHTIKKCIDLGIDCYVAVLNDPAIMTREEFDKIKDKLQSINYKNGILEEKLVMSRGCIKRLHDHHRKYPEYQYNFYFRKNFWIISCDDRDCHRVKRMQSGIYRVIDQKPIVTYNLDYINDLEITENIQTVVLVGCFYNKEKAYYDGLIRQVFRKSIKEIIFINTDENLIDESEKLNNNLKVLYKNYINLNINKINKLDDMTAKDEVTAGNNITYYWTGNR